MLLLQALVSLATILVILAVTPILYVATLDIIASLVSKEHHS